MASGASVAMVADAVNEIKCGYSLCGRSATQARLSVPIQLEMMTEYDLIHNDEGSGYHVEYLNSGSLSYDWTEKLSTYFEVATLFGTQDPLGGIVTLDTGVLYKFGHDWCFDVGTNFGITRASDRVDVTVGLSKRF